jgi:hypothetical protein
MTLSRLLFTTSLLLSLNAWAGPKHETVSRVVDGRMPVTTPAGQGTATLELSTDWNSYHPEIRRALIIVHGHLRNAETYFASGQKAADAANETQETLIIAPQFLAQADIPRNNLPSDILRWTPASWMGGYPAISPAPISSFEVFDSILAHLADRKNLPNLREVVIAGHSGGGQVVQRYAILGHGDTALTNAGIGLRYVVANPSSYAYFTADRPTAAGGVGPFPAAGCPDYDQWKFGMNNLAPYAGNTTAQKLEQAYVSRKVTYLLGALDTDPNHPALDKSCQAEAQGAYRLARGESYFQYLQARHPQGLNQRLVTVPGVGHNGDGMFTSPQGLKALFGEAK